MATATDANAADEKSDKSIWQLLNARNVLGYKNLYYIRGFLYYAYTRSEKTGLLRLYELAASPVPNLQFR